ncbi:hypothetical protein [Pedobacter endophyticus]|uniref:GLPGLI family protein n=1 Tax=Pedobacter endophyticus TaxID=2789740 RepID=A0A7S9KYH7_9SPHI|nr:hypothetical protein [Pedobacter endophyticus]QPH39179.1 hypothetical protein IZT61_19320 [Pedobacter endophyticus]
MKNKYILISVLVCLFVSAINLRAQQMIKASVVIQQPGDENHPMPYQINIISNAEVERGMVDDSALEGNAKAKFREESRGSKLGVNIIIFPSYNLTEIKTGKSWSLSDHGKYKIALLETKAQKPVDSSTYFSLHYTNQYKKIAGYTCQKVIVTNKISNIIDSIYVVKELNYLVYRMTYKYGKIDFIVQAYEHNNGRTQTYTIISAKEELVPVDIFKIPRDYKKFYSIKRYKKWMQRKGTKEFNKKLEMQKK